MYVVALGLAWPSWPFFPLSHLKDNAVFLPGFVTGMGPWDRLSQEAAHIQGSPSCVSENVPQQDEAKRHVHKTSRILIADKNRIPTQSIVVVLPSLDHPACV